MAKHNILIVDDEQNILDLLKKTFKDEYNVFLASSGEEALSVIEENDIALIIADDHMPGMSGVEFLEKTAQKKPNTIRLILSGYIDRNMLMAAINTAHAHGVIPKPHDTEEIRLTVRRWVERYERLMVLEEANQALAKLYQRIARIVNGLNNPLTLIATNIELARVNIEEGELDKAIEKLAEATEAITGVKNLTKELSVSPHEKWYLRYYGH